jgi:hypothetical protein
VYAADADLMLRHWRVLVAAGIIETEETNGE